MDLVQPTLTTMILSCFMVSSDFKPTIYVRNAGSTGHNRARPYTFHSQPALKDSLESARLAYYTGLHYDRLTGSSVIGGHAPRCGDIYQGPVEVVVSLLYALCS